MSKTFFRETFPPSPKGMDKLIWYGPGLLWMLSAVGTGSILFTPRVASAYQFELLWLLLLVVFFMWVMIREMARYTIASGHTMLEGMHTLPGPKNWAVWVIFVPQLLAAAVGIAGLSAVVGSAMAAFLPGKGWVYGMITVLVSTAFTLSGRYQRIEKVSRVMAVALLSMAIVSAVMVAPEPMDLVNGIWPSWPRHPDFYIIFPWVGTILAGSMGIVWFGYWTASRGYGGGLVGREKDDEMAEDTQVSEREDEEDGQNPRRRAKRGHEWIRVMTGTATLAVVGGGAVIVAFMILGAELLAPKNVLPSGPDVAIDLARLFSEIWGGPGRYLLLSAIIIALGGSVLANQDGWGRSFADMTLILTRTERQEGRSSSVSYVFDRLNELLPFNIYERRNLKCLYILCVTGVFPIGIILTFSDPVRVMSVSGIVAAFHTPFIVFTALCVNRLRLPASMRPNLATTLLMASSGFFYLGFGVMYFIDLLG